MNRIQHTKYVTIENYLKGHKFVVYGTYLEVVAALCCLLLMRVTDITLSSRYKHYLHL